MNTDHMNAPQLAGLELRKKIARLFSDGRPRTVGDVRTALGIADSQALHNLKKLTEMGLLDFEQMGGSCPAIWTANIGEAAE